MYSNARDESSSIARWILELHYRMQRTDGGLGCDLLGRKQWTLRNLAEIGKEKPRR
jgi:hypothetical protein